MEITRKYFSIWLPTISRERPYILVEERDVFPYLTCNYRVVYDVSGARGIWQKWGKVLDITKNVIFAEFFGIFSVFLIIEGNSLDWCIMHCSLWDKISSWFNILNILLTFIYCLPTIKIETSLVIKCVLVLIVKLKYSNLRYSTFSFPSTIFPRPEYFNPLPQKEWFGLHLVWLIRGPSLEDIFLLLPFS